MTRWITDRLGTAPYLQGIAEAEVVIVDVRDLLDGAGNAPADVRDKIEEGVKYLRDGYRVVVCCEHGVSRSNAVAAGILAEWEGLSLDRALDAVLARIGEDSMRLGVLATVREALGEHPEPTNQSLVLVTGGTGFIGSRLTQLLDGGLAPAREEIDLLHDSSVLDRLVRRDGVGTVVHLAQPKILTNRTMGESLTMLKNVVDVCAQNALHLIYVSGWEVYGGYREGPLIADETLPRRPAGINGYTWALAEDLIEQVSSRAGIDYTLIRSGVGYREGVMRPRFLKPLLERALKNEPVVTHRYRNGFPHLDLPPPRRLDFCCRRRSGTKGYRDLSHRLRESVSTTILAEKIIAAANSASPIVHHDIDEECPNIVMSTSEACSRLGWLPRLTRRRRSMRSSEASSREGERFDERRECVMSEEFSMGDPRTQTEADRAFAGSLGRYFDQSLGTNVDKLRNFAKYVPRQTLAHFLAKNEILKRVLGVHGHFIECGVFLGGGLMTWAQLSAVYEPLNHTRRIVGFDTFEGFSSFDDKDAIGSISHAAEGGLFAHGAYDDITRGIELYDLNRPIGHIERVQLVVGDGTRTMPQYVEDNPQLVVAMLYLDFDLYEPTKIAIETFLPRMPRGAVLAFDELNQKVWPGETVAVLETIGVRNLRIERFPFTPQLSFAVLD